MIYNLYLIDSIYEVVFQSCHSSYILTITRLAAGGQLIFTVYCHFAVAWAIDITLFATAIIN